MIACAIAVMCLIGAATSAPVTSCPSDDAIVAELDRLGTARAVAALGSPSVTVDGTTMWVKLRGLDGEVSGVRQVNAPAACAERAAVAATVISAWVGTWSVGAPSPSPSATATPAAAVDGMASPRISVPRLAAPGAPISPVEATPVAHDAAPLSQASSPLQSQPSAQVSAPTPVVPLRPVRRSGELGGYAFGTHDTNVGTVGGGLLATYRAHGGWGIHTVFDGTGERQRQVGPGLAAYRVYGLGLGPSFGMQSGHLYADIALIPQATLLSIEGRNLQHGNRVSRWGLSLGARLRLGLTSGALRPFMFAGVTCALRDENLTLDNTPDSITLSRWNLSGGAGLAYIWDIGGPGVTKSSQPATR